MWTYSPSGNINEAIRVILNFLIFFQKNFARTKSTKRLQANKNKKSSILMRLKNIYGEESHLFTYLRFCAFCDFCACRIFLQKKKKIK